MSRRQTRVEAKRLLAARPELATLVRCVLSRGRLRAQRHFEHLDDALQLFVLKEAPTLYRWLDPENDREQT